MVIKIEAEGKVLTITEECIKDEAVLLHVNPTFKKGLMTKRTEELLKSFCMQYLDVFAHGRVIGTRSKRAFLKIPKQFKRKVDKHLNQVFKGDYPTIPPLPEK